MTVTLHTYERCRFSGAGNCHCGAAEHSFAHPHRFLSAYSDPSLCVCGQPAGTDVHLLGTIWSPATPVEAAS